jgi:hypothetical protein
VANGKQAANNPGIEADMHDIPFVQRLRDRIAAKKEPQKIKAFCEVLRTMIGEKDSAVALRPRLLEKRHQRISQDALADAENLRPLPKLDLDAVRPEA